MPKEPIVREPILSLSLIWRNPGKLLWMDEIHFAPPKKALFLMIRLCKPTKVIVSTLVSNGACRISSTPSYGQGIADKTQQHGNL